MARPVVEDVPPGSKVLVSGEVSPAGLLQWLQEVPVRDAEVLLDENLADSFWRNFPFNSKLNQLVEENGLTIRSSDAERLPTAVVENQTVHYLVRVGSVERPTEITDSDAVEAFKAEADRLFDVGDDVELDVPAWNQLLDKLEGLVDSETRGEFERIIQAAELADLGSLDEVSVALIAAAQSGALTYDLSKWGEEVGFASKATFSRRKTSLEDDGVIYTESVPVDIGRPKHRIHLADSVDGISLDIGIDDDQLGLPSPRGDGQSRPLGTKDDTSQSEGTESDASDSDTATTRGEEDDQSSEILAQIEKEIQDAISSS